MVADMIRRGQLTEAESRYHPNRSVITRALGTDPNMSADTYEVDAEPGDRLLLCSDGLTAMLEDGAIGEALAAYRDPAIAARMLVDAANDAGGHDNISVVVVDIEGDGSRARAPPSTRAAPAPAAACSPSSAGCCCSRSSSAASSYGSYAVRAQAGVPPGRAGRRRLRLPGGARADRLAEAAVARASRPTSRSTPRRPPTRQALREGMRFDSLDAALQKARSLEADDPAVPLGTVHVLAPDHRAAPPARGDAAGAARLRARRRAEGPGVRDELAVRPRRAARRVRHRASRRAAVRAERRPRAAPDRLRALRHRAGVRHAARRRRSPRRRSCGCSSAWRRSSRRWSPCRRSSASRATSTRSWSAASCCCCCPAVIGREVNGAKLWLRFGGFGFQPGEIAKILIVLFLAAYLAENRELLSVSTRRVLGDAPPRAANARPAAAHVGASRCSSWSSRTTSGRRCCSSRSSS